MRKHGYVESSAYDTFHKCAKCGKSIQYQQPMHIDTWAEVVKAFIRKHKDCDE